MAKLASSPPLGMAPRHARRLAALNGASPQAIAEAISLWPLGARLLLWALNIIDYNAGEDAAERGGSFSREEILAAAREGEPMDFGVTERGLRVIKQCAEWRWAEEPAEAEDDQPSDPELSDDEHWPEGLASSDELEGARGIR